ncbi:MAG TPA: hypothetical protein VGH02_07755 [Rhizomicrobium sp.]
MPDDHQAKALRDLAVLAVARRGALERSGAANLAVLREDGLMIGYHTPFNPLPKLGDGAKYEAALERKDTTRNAYGVEIWLEEFGKVFSACWSRGDDLHIRLCRPGSWQIALKNIAHRIEKEPAMPRKKRTTSARGEKAIANCPTAIPEMSLPDDGRNNRLRLLEQENKNLRRAISGLMLDKLILAKAAAGKL